MQYKIFWFLTGLPELYGLACLLWTIHFKFNINIMMWTVFDLTATSLQVQMGSVWQSWKGFPAVYIFNANKGHPISLTTWFCRSLHLPADAANRQAGHTKHSQPESQAMLSWGLGKMMLCAKGAYPWLLDIMPVTAPFTFWASQCKCVDTISILNFSAADL